MAERRMIAKSIIETDSFLDMPMSTQCLYFHLLLRGDDDGFIANPKAVLRNTGCKDDDMKLLVAKKYVLIFDSGVIVIRHWKIHNYIQKDRYHPSRCVERDQLLVQKGEPYEIRKEPCIQDVYNMDPNRIQSGDIGKVRLELDQVSIDKTNNNTNSGCGCSSFNNTNNMADREEVDFDNNNDHHDSFFDKDLAAIIQFYEDNFSTVSSFIAQQIDDLKTEYGVEWLHKAMEKAVVSGRDKCNLRYVEGILKSWKNRGVAKPWETRLTAQQRKEAELVKQQEQDALKRAELAKQREAKRKQQEQAMAKHDAELQAQQDAEWEQLKKDNPEKWLEFEINRLRLFLRMRKPGDEVRAECEKKIKSMEQQLQGLRQV